MSDKSKSFERQLSAVKSVERIKESSRITKRIREAAKTGNYSFAEQVKIDRYNSCVQNILDEVADYLGEQGIRKAWVSDRSCLSDFAGRRTDKLVKYLIPRLGVRFDRGDYICDIAKQMAETNMS